MTDLQRFDPSLTMPWNASGREYRGDHSVVRRAAGIAHGK